jgi:hypothetical protein
MKRVSPAADFRLVYRPFELAGWKDRGKVEEGAGHGGDVDAAEDGDFVRGQL